MSNVVIFVWGIIVSGFMFGGSGVYVCFFIYTLLRSIYIHTYMYICNIHSAYCNESCNKFGNFLQIHPGAVSCIQVEAGE